VSVAQAFVLGIVQGLTEFLPISSSGHLILVPRVLGWPDQGLAFDAVIHLGSLLALVLYFRIELLGVLRGFLIPTDAGRPGRTLGWFLILGTLPAALVGYLYANLIEARFRGPGVVALSLIVWALVMWVADRQAERRPLPVTSALGLTWPWVLFVGCAQAIALIPGTSRSGITIIAGLAAGLTRKEAARFSFLLGVPVTFAAGAEKALELARAGAWAAEGGTILAALVATCLASLAAIAFLVRYLERRRLTPFVYYRLVLGGLILLLLWR